MRTATSSRSTAKAGCPLHPSREWVVVGRVGREMPPEAEILESGTPEDDNWGCGCER